MANVDQPETYQGSCQCGQFAFKATLPIPISSPQCRLTKCDCSICTRNGYHLVYVLRTDVTWLRGWDTLTNYRFNTKSVDHKFCPTCGSSLVMDPHCFYNKLEGFETAPDIVGLNVRFFVLR